MALYWHFSYVIRHNSGNLLSQENILPLEDSLRAAASAIGYHATGWCHPTDSIDHSNCPSDYATNRPSPRGNSELWHVSYTVISLFSNDIPAAEATVMDQRIRNDLGAAGFIITSGDFHNTLNVCSDQCEWEFTVDGVAPPEREL